ncbi:UNVERIFIED_CONTAM: hypothetical protein HDU68_009331 [Siphonaria sp. JEL0065]|nr:hypothetical protein HDU68_009331 [Siphonaria sp. JEL0065]
MPPKIPKKKKEEYVPQTFDEWIESAIDFEEKGDRYKDGDKARRFYEQAVQCYSSASAFASDAFCLFNKGRLLLLLAEFKNPAYTLSQQRTLLEDAAKSLRDAVELDQLHPDSMFTLAQTIKAVFERILDNGDVVTQTHLARLSEADILLERALVLQLAELEKSKAIASASTADACEQGCGHDHDDHSGHGHAHEEADDAMEEAEPETEGGDEGYELVNQQEPVTNRTIIDTLVEHSSLLTLAASALYSISAEQAEQLYMKSHAKLSATATLWPEPNNTTNEPSDIGLARAALFVARGESLFEASPKTEATSAPWKALFEQAGALYDDILARNPTCAEAPADKGDLLCTLAESIMTITIGCPGVPGFEALINNVILEQQQLQQQQQSGGSSSSALQQQQQQHLPSQTFLTQLRQIYSQASKAYSQAQAIEPSKASVSHRLGDLEATRTSLCPPSLNPSNVNTQQILLKNSATHYKRALDALGVTINVLSTPKSCADEEAARGSLFGIAKVLSHFEGREGDVKNALVCWKRRGGVFGEDGEGCAIAFSERVLALEWFEKVIR